MSERATQPMATHEPGQILLRENDRLRAQCETLRRERDEARARAQRLDQTIGILVRVAGGSIAVARAVLDHGAPAPYVRQVDDATAQVVLVAVRAGDE